MCLSYDRKHLYTDMERISRIWEIELQAVLEINKTGHRKRILYSVGATPPKNIEKSFERLKSIHVSGVKSDKFIYYYIFNENIFIYFDIGCSKQDKLITAFIFIAIIT